MIPAGVPADAGADHEPPPDPAAGIGVTLADLRRARAGVTALIGQYERSLLVLKGRQGALDALIDPLEAELAEPPKPKRRARK